MDSLQPMIFSGVYLGMQDWGFGHSLGGILSGLGKVAEAGGGAGGSREGCRGRGSAVQCSVRCPG